MTMSEMKNCDLIYASVLNMEESDTSLFDLANCFINGYDLDKLRTMLMSDDIGIVSDGIFVLSEIGVLAEQFSAELEFLSTSEDEDIAREAQRMNQVYSVGRN